MAPSEILHVFQIAGRSFIALFPYVVAGVAIGEILRLGPWTSLLHRLCVRSPVFSVIVFALLGMISPLCTYGTIPLVLRLYQDKVPLSPLGTFLVSSSLMNPQLFVLTWGGIGPEMAVARAGSVLLFGLAVGAVLHWLPERFVVNASLSAEQGPPKKEPNGLHRISKSKAFFHGFWQSLQYVGFYVIVGLLLGALIEVFVPGNLIYRLFKPGSWNSVLLAALLGVPLYACGGGTIPLVRSLLGMGMSRGSALAFFVVGPATRVTPLIALAALLRPVFLLGYVCAIVIFACIVGMLYG